MATTKTRGSGGSSGKRHGSAEKSHAVPHTRVADELAVKKNYEWTETLGKGTFGVVYYAKQKGSDTVWACKAVNKEKAGSANIKLLEREVSILKNVNHEHVIKLNEVFETSKKMYLILEYCDRGELANLLKKKRTFSEEDTRRIMKRLVNAIAYLHKKDTVHRDLKLENILLATNPNQPDDDLYVKITDFGLSVQKSGVTHDDMMADMCGTPVYMAPEILHNKTYSEKCDIWALGVIMYQLLSGNSPFNASDPEQLEKVIAETDIRAEFKKRSVWKNVSVEARDCICGMLTVDPAYRLTASEVLDHAWLQGTSLSNAPAPINVLELMKMYNKEERTQSDNTQNGHSRRAISAGLPRASSKR